MQRNTPNDQHTPPPFDPLDAQYLKDRAVPLDLAVKCGLRSESDSVARKGLPASYGFAHKTLPCGGLNIPYFETEDGVTLYRMRLRHTTITERPVEGSHHGETTKTLPKFIATAGSDVCPYIAPVGMPKGWKTDTTIALLFTEGPIKALSLLAAGYPGIGLGGVEAGFHDVAEWHDAHHLELHPVLRRVRWSGRVVYLASDAGRLRNPSVARGEARLALLLRQAGAVVRLVDLPFVDGHGISDELLYDAKDQGPDDFLARRGRDAFQTLVDAAVSADPIEQVKNAPDADAIRRLLAHLPFQAALAVGGERVIGPVAVEMKARKTGIGPKAVKEAVADYEHRAGVQMHGKMPEWGTALTRTAAGAIKGTIANATTILANAPEWAGALAYDLFAEASVLRKEPPWGDAEKPAKPFTAGQPLEEEDAARLVAWLEREHEMVISTSMAHEVLEVAAHANAFHPVRDYLNALVWDGVQRVAGKEGPGVFTMYAGVADSAYVRCVGRWFMIGAVARVMCPGCKLDTMVILEGPQGKRKSTFLNVLFGDAWFSDTISELGSKDSYQDLRGKWCIEMGELDALTRAESSTTKKFLAKKRDNYRPSYGRRNRDVPRQTLFAGSVNLDAYLKDFTGNRRFHPIKCGIIDIDALRRDRDQLWAEALHLYKADEHWWPEGDEAKLCEDEQEDRRQRDPWEAAIANALKGINETTTGHVLGNVFAITADQQHRGHETRVGQVMIALGWAKHRRRLEDGTREWFYLRPGTEPSAEPKPQVDRDELYVEDAISPEELARLMDEHSEANVIEIACGMSGTSTVDIATVADSAYETTSDEDADDDDAARRIAYRSVYGRDYGDEVLQ